MSDRLFPLDEIPEVPLFREPRGARGAAISDERLAHDYPPEWSSCLTCGGCGRLYGPVESGEADEPDVLYVWLIRDPEDAPVLGQAGRAKARGVELVSIVRNPPHEMGAYLGFRRRNVACTDCLGMGSIKARVRLEAGHRCVRCQHPFMPRADAKMLATEPTPGRWSPCDAQCTHAGPVRALADPEIGWETFLGAYNVAGVISAGVPVEAEWRVLTVHHLDGDKANLRWWNLAALCQRDHLYMQQKVVMERVYPWEHSEWFKPFAAGFYAFRYLGLELTREETMARLDELLALERAV